MTLSIYMRKFAKEKPDYVLSPEGTLRIADTEGGPIVFTYVLFWVRKRILNFQFAGGFLPF